MKITHDLHIHTTLSLCGKPDATVENYFAAAKERGLTKLGFADHMWDEKIPLASAGFYEKQGVSHVLSLKDTLKNVDTNGIKVLVGCETEYDPLRGDIAITQESAEKFDFVLVPTSHTHMMMPKEFLYPYEKHIEFMVQAYENAINSPVSRYITAMAHPFAAVCCPYDRKILLRMIDDDTYKRVFTKTAEKGIAVEISLVDFRTASREDVEASPLLRMFSIAKDCGCKFTFGSDAHTIANLAAHDRAEDLCDLLSLREDDLAPIAR
ncbi:MAG: PHP domain-containing protein [Clostridia bacterium]|nr:PHP domain-containing protein [Clostridia bacterium]